MSPPRLTPPRSALGLTRTLGLVCALLTGCVTPDFGPSPGDPGAGRTLGPGEHFETLSYQVSGTDTGISLLLGLIPLSRPVYIDAYRDTFAALGLSPDDPTLALGNMKVSTSFSSLLLVDWFRITVTADLLRVVKDDPGAATPPDPGSGGTTTDRTHGSP